MNKQQNTSIQKINSESDDYQDMTIVSTQDLPEQSIFGLNHTYVSKQVPKGHKQNVKREPLNLTWAEKWAMYKAAVSLVFPVILLMIAVMGTLIFGLLYLWGGFN